MKKLLSIITILLTAIILGSSLTGCYFDNGKKMVRTYESMKAACPKDMGDGITMKDVEYNGSTFTITTATPNVSKSQIAGIKPAVIDYVKGQYSFANGIKTTQTTVIYRFECSDGTADVTILPGDLE